MDNCKRDLEKAVKLLKEGNYSCVLCREDQVYSSEKHGVAPLLGWKDKGTDLSGYSAADRVVGKAAALLYAGFGVAQIYCGILSERGKEVLEANRIPYTAGEIVKEIRNASGTDMCPMEMAVIPAEDPEEAARLLKEQMARLRSGQPPLRNGV